MAALTETEAVVEIIETCTLPDNLQKRNQRLREIVRQLQPAQHVQNQAKAWVETVTMLMCDYGLEHTEPGEVAHQQVLNFLRRRLK